MTPIDVHNGVMKNIMWITNDPEIAHRLRLADAWASDQRRQANRMAFDADRARRAATALLAKVEADRQADYAEIARSAAERAS